MCIYRLTAGYHRNKYKISYSKITAMSGIKKVSPIMKNLKKKKMVSFTSENGKISEIRILQPVHSGHRTSPLRSSHQSTKVIGLRGAKENLNKDLKKEKTIYSYEDMVFLCSSKGLVQNKDFERVGKKFRRLI